MTFDEPLPSGYNGRELACTGTQHDDSLSEIQQMWTLSSSMFATYEALFNPGPQHQLLMMRSVSDTAQSVVGAVNGSIDQLKDLFSSGQASPFDESSSRGYSLLRVSLNASFAFEIYSYALMFDSGRSTVAFPEITTTGSFNF